MIELAGVTKRFGAKVAVDDLSLRVERGEILGLLGPNGAGKTTTMRIITGYLPPTAGTVRVADVPVPQNPVAVKKAIGYLPETPPLYAELTVREQLAFVAEIKGLPRAERSRDVARAMEETVTLDVADRLVGNLSRGYRQRVGLAQALLGDPQVLILDEPTVGLDPRQIIEIRELIRDLAGERTVILSSHILPEVSQLCQRVAIINRGHLVAQDTPENLARALGRAQRLEAEIKGRPEEIRAALEKVPGVAEVSVGEEVPGRAAGAAASGPGEEDAAQAISAVTLGLAPGADPFRVREDMFFALAAAGLPLLALSAEQLSLEEVFMQLVVEEPAAN
ncbi:MAG: ABC transporter ATP-binding protein [Clostridia bacterium]|nr:MAG: ABC transporter ATP-binding protein [Clostridia bacterium]